MTTKQRTRVTKGMTFRKHYADGMPEWTVMGKCDAKTWYVEILDDMDWAGVQDVLTSGQILAIVNRDAALQDHFEQQDDWFDSLTPGTVLHYCNGFKTFIRCEVVMGRSANLRDHNGSIRDEYLDKPVLLPVAMIGEWKPNDLPRIDPYSGDVLTGYHARAILEHRGAWRPSEGCVYESPNVSGNYNGGPDPRAMEPCDLTPRPLTVDQLRDLPAWQAVAQVRAAVEYKSRDDRTPQQILDDVRAALAD